MNEALYILKTREDIKISQKDVRKQTLIKTEANISGMKLKQVYIKKDEAAT